MFALPPSGLASWEIVAFSALCAAVVLSVATAIGVSVAFFATREPRASRQFAPAHATQPQLQPAGAISPSPALAR